MGKFSDIHRSVTQFYFALTNPEAESLLKVEVKSRFPEFNLSYSRPGFLTFKGPATQVFNPYLARLTGVCLGKFKLSELSYEKAWVWKREENLNVPSDLQALSDKTFFKIGEKATVIMMIGPEEYWVGEYILKSTHLQTPGEISSIEKKSVPSRAYYKIAEAQESFDLQFDHQEIVLELGSAPGGASLFLLEQDLRVIGVDPAEMDPEIVKNNNFRHWRRPFETLVPADFKNDIDWIVSDINLPPTVVISQVQRVLGFLNPRGILLTLKLNEDRHLYLLPRFVEEFKRQGFTKIEINYLPSHRREIALLALKT